MRALATDWQAAAMPDAAIASQVHQPLDRLLHFAPQIAFDLVILVEHLADTDLLLGVEDLERGRPANPVDVGKRDLHALVPGQFDARDTRHLRILLPLALLVAR